ncbi:hypothetical protein OAJ13_00795 [Euryarchaeota archaeon]|nr:hypothetical protein [Euryarchaeota archaeon]
MKGPEIQNNIIESTNTPWNEKNSSINQTTPIDKPNLNGAKVASIIIFLSILVPYISFDINDTGDPELDLTGVEIIETWFELFEAIMEVSDSGLDTEGSESPSGSLDMPLRVYVLLIGAFMLLLSPILFAFSSIIGGFFSFSGMGLPKTLGKIHLGFFIIMILMLLIGGSIIFSEIPDEEGMPSSMLDFLGIGVWLGGLSSIGYFIEMKTDE